MLSIGGCLRSPSHPAAITFSVIDDAAVSDAAVVAALAAGGLSPAAARPHFRRFIISLGEALALLFALT